MDHVQRINVRNVVNHVIHQESKLLKAPFHNFVERLSVFIEFELISHSQGIKTYQSGVYTLLILLIQVFHYLVKQIWKLGREVHQANHFERPNELLDDGFVNYLLENSPHDVLSDALLVLLVQDDEVQPPSNSMGFLIISKLPMDLN